MALIDCRDHWQGPREASLGTFPRRAKERFPTISSFHPFAFLCCSCQKLLIMDLEKESFAALTAFLGDEVQSRHADLLLFTCCLTSGLIDSTIYDGATHS